MKKKEKKKHTNCPGSDPIVTRAQGKQDPKNHLRALPTMAPLTGPQRSARYKNESYK